MSNKTDNRDRNSKLIADVYERLGRAAVFASDFESAQQLFAQAESTCGPRSDGANLAADRFLAEAASVEFGRGDRPEAGREKLADTVSRVAVFLRDFDRCRPFLSTDALGDLDEVRSRGVERLFAESEPEPETVLAEAIVTGDGLLGTNPPLRFAEQKDLRVLVREILVDECYRTSPSKAKELIIDAGSNFGLSIFYLKSRLPNAHIVAFEPNPHLVEILQENASRHRWSSVDIHPVALTGTSGDSKLLVPKTMPMGGSLSSRMAARGHEYDSFAVSCEPLSPYLAKPVDLLKLDIEGPEVEVLEEAESVLRNVKRIYCEFHFGSDLPVNRLPRLLALLERVGFSYTVGGGESTVASPRPTDRFGLAKAGASLDVHAVRID